LDPTNNENALSTVRRVVKLTGFVNATDDFQDHPKVINGCSDLLVEVFGETGKHARSAVGVSSLPLNITVEIEARSPESEIRDPRFEMFSLGELERAAEVVHRVLPETPQIRWPLLCEKVKTEVWVKQENHTPIGAFKIRGALFYISELKRTNRFPHQRPTRWPMECPAGFQIRLR
jgi:hypothetical protein